MFMAVKPKLYLFLKSQTSGHMVFQKYLYLSRLKKCFTNIFWKYYYQYVKIKVFCLWIFIFISFEYLGWYEYVLVAFVGLTCFCCICLMRNDVLRSNQNSPTKDFCLIYLWSFSLVINSALGQEYVILYFQPLLLSLQCLFLPLSGKIVLRLIALRPRMGVVNISSEVDRDGNKVEATWRYWAYEESDRSRKGVTRGKWKSNGRQDFSFQYYYLIKGDKASWRNG